ncbi:MAG: 16S rRNA (uracil(1498)-N(3))-methyltransferase [Candidatus Hydrogenedentota bacterium]|nr:MAG: 16S rRNA (uracil(1498)-N(3))-methyltransferase [Candidatus Hydrogenedentota bacterium]
MNLYEADRYLVFESKSFLEKAKQSRVLLSKENIHHLRKVRRLSGILNLIVSDGCDHYAMGILEEDNFFQLKEFHSITVEKPQIEVYIPYIRKKRLKWAVEKATELGAHKIYFIRTQKTAQPEFSLSQFQEVAKSACEQTSRVDLPSIQNSSFPPTISDALVFVALIGAEKSIIDYEKEIMSADHIVILVGPEGDFSAEEKEFLKKDFLPVGLSKNVLRSETALITALSQLNAVLWKLCK